MIDGFKKKRPGDSRRRYLRYDDVFMSPEQQEQRVKRAPERHSVEQPPSPRNRPRNMHYTERREPVYDHDYDQDDREQQYEYEPEEPEPRGYFSQRDNNIINERMVRYQKRQLPPLQRYTPNQHRDMYSEFNKSYWDEDYQGRGQSRQYAFSDIWRKFVVTFSSILSLICLSWIAYNWGSDKSDRRETSDGPPIIEPSRPSFKVLPDSPGGEEIPHKDKTVYGRISKIQQREVDETLLPLPSEEEFPQGNQRQSVELDHHEPVETYSIIDDRIYYIKISAGKDRSILENEAVLLKKKFAQLLTGKTCSVKRVSNSSGEQKNAVLIGPFASQESAVNTARELGMQCYVISVKD
ncbi:MAG: SPOR domain-containing protein [Holosporales bacterium]|nr:SPOR domain-containing protein [Holosporales bacterium]